MDEKLTICVYRTNELKRRRRRENIKRKVCEIIALTSYTVLLASILFCMPPAGTISLICSILFTWLAGGFDR